MWRTSIVTGQVTDGKNAIKGVSVVVFHTDSKGLYATTGPNDDDHARLHGAMRTERQRLLQL